MFNGSPPSSNTVVYMGKERWSRWFIWLILEGCLEEARCEVSKGWTRHLHVLFKDKGGMGGALKKYRFLGLTSASQG